MRHEGLVHSETRVQAQALPTPRPHQNFVDSAGNACNGCSLYSYLARHNHGECRPMSTTPRRPKTPTRSFLDAAGGGNIWFDPAVTYKFLLCEGSSTAPGCLLNGGATQWTVDQVPGSGSSGVFCPLSGCTFTGNVTAPGFVGPLTGIASGNCPLTGCTLTGELIIGTGLNFYITNLTQLNTAISNCGSNAGCWFFIGAGITINSSTTFPANSTIVFNAGNFNGSGAISMPHASILVQGTQSVFTGANAITGLDIADPSWWGGRTTGASFGNAVSSLTNGSGGTLILGLGTYASPTTISASNIRIVGSGMPEFNSGYTALTGGSIIQGVLQITGNYDSVENLGIDAGSAFQWRDLHPTG